MSSVHPGLNVTPVVPSIDDLPRPLVRMRRLRRSPGLRQLLQDTVLTPDDLIAPLFVRADSAKKVAIPTMPGQYQWSVDRLAEALDPLLQFKVPAVLLFGLPSHKDPVAAVACDDDGVIQRAITAIKQYAPDLLVIADLCFCEYTTHGHCGVLDATASCADVIDNDASLLQLQQQALSLARAGVDVLAPSCMLDGMVAAVRQVLDANGFQHVAILSYAVKYASNYYGPFRAAADGAPQHGDRRTYQMDYANKSQALMEAELDVQEAADILMVKPAMAYLDIIASLRQAYPSMPLFAYQVSGTYSMMRQAMSTGMLDPVGGMLESLLAIKRAGANAIITYFAAEAAQAFHQHWS